MGYAPHLPDAADLAKSPSFGGLLAVGAVIDLAVVLGVPQTEHTGLPDFLRFYPDPGIRWRRRTHS